MRPHASPCTPMHPQIIPVDLNAFLVGLARDIATAARLAGDGDTAVRFDEHAAGACPPCTTPSVLSPPASLRVLTHLSSAMHGCGLVWAGS